jgi:proline iminopeptidase
MTAAWYPEGEPYASGVLAVSDGHVLAYEEYGNPEGIPVVSLHGGPGGGRSSVQKRKFDPQRWRVVLFDQRGCGQSTPYASLDNNTTWDLVADIERLREHLGIDAWVVEGGSWGATLSLAYAITHRERVNGVILRGVFLCRKQDIDWLYQSGANAIFPDAWEHYESFIPESERANMLHAYRRRLDDPDAANRTEAARRFAGWEVATLYLRPDPEVIASLSHDEHLVAIAQIESHYFVNGAFFASDNWLLEQAGLLRDLPIEIVHGRYDVVCPVNQAWALARALPQANLVIVPDAGHSAGEVGISAALAVAADRMADRLAPTNPN